MPGREAINLIKRYLDEYNLLEEYSFDGDIFHEKIKLGDKDYGVAGVFFHENPNLLANYIFKKHSTEVDIVLLINLENKIVILRKNKDCDMDLGKLAKQLSTGGGKNEIAGCLLNEKILNLTKLLKPLTC
jgi:adenine specific DNA methylase Mod